MAESRGKKKKLSINLSFLSLTDNTLFTKPNGSHKSVKIFQEPDGVVGLGILAALSHHHQDPNLMNCGRDAVLAISPKSWANPTPILNDKSFTPVSANGNDKNKKLSVGEMELCEEYTCVISHVGDNMIKKREYFDADLFPNSNGSDGFSIGGGPGGGGFWVSSGMVSDSAVTSVDENYEFRPSGYLDSCFLCKKTLHGLDIFMYRGEKAFCSAECRSKQISIDEHKEKFGTGMRKPMEYSASPCSSNMQFFVGVAAA